MKLISGFCLSMFLGLHMASIADEGLMETKKKRRSISHLSQFTISKTPLRSKQVPSKEPIKVKLPCVEEFSQEYAENKSKLHKEKITRSKETQNVLKQQPQEKNIQYDYLDENYVKSIIRSNFRYVLVGTGWSESSMGKMNLNNQEKQKRAFALSYGQMMKIEKLGGKGRLIYLTTAKISPYYRRYLYRLAHRSRIKNLQAQEIERQFRAFERRALRVVYFSARHREKDAHDVTAYLTEKSNRFRQVKLPKALNALRNDIYSSNYFVGFTAHFSGPYLETLAKKWELPYLVNPSEHAHWIKKSKSRQSFRNAGVLHPRGTYEPSFTIEDLVNDIYNLLIQLDYKKIVLKLDQSAAGYGNKVMRFDEITNDLTEEEAKDLIRRRFDDGEIFPEIFIKRIEEEDGGAIVEEFIDCKNYASPASIYMINKLNDVNMRYTYDQLLGGKDNQVFQGSIGPIFVDPDYPPGDINALSIRVGKTLSLEGVRGNVGTDFVTCDVEHEGQIRRKAWAIENNVRMTGTSYPLYTLMTLIGQERVKKLFVKSFDDVKIPVIPFKKYRNRVQRDMYLSFLLTHPDALSVRRARGCMIHNDTFRLGKLGVACIGSTAEETTAMYDRFSEDISKFVDEHDATNECRKFTKVTELERLKMSLNEAKKSMENLIVPVALSKKHFKMHFDPQTVRRIRGDNNEENIRKPMRPETVDMKFQENFFKDHVYNDESYFNPNKGVGCMVNNDIFKFQQLGIMCVSNSAQMPEAYYNFYDKLKTLLFQLD